MVVDATEPRICIVSPTDSQVQTLEELRVFHESIGYRDLKLCTNGPQGKEYTKMVCYGDIVEKIKKVQGIAQQWDTWKKEITSSTGINCPTAENGCVTYTTVESIDLIARAASLLVDWMKLVNLGDKIADAAIVALLTLHVEHFHSFLRKHDDMPTYMEIRLHPSSL